MMIRQSENQRLGDTSGFTLIEMLVVVIILGILAMIIVPQITVSTGDARLNTLQTNLNTLRSAVEVYAAQHINRYPGTYKETDGTSPVATDLEAHDAFIAQLTQYTDINGKVATVKDTTFKYGPYIKLGKFPTNPFNENNDVACDFDENDITAARVSDGSGKGWRYFAPIGVFFANDSDAHAAL